MVCSYRRLLDELEWLRLGMWGMTGDVVFFVTIPNRDIWVSLVQHCTVCIVLQFSICLGLGSYMH